MNYIKEAHSLVKGLEARQESVGESINTIAVMEDDIYDIVLELHDIIVEMADRIDELEDELQEKGEENE